MFHPSHQFTAGSFAFTYIVTFGVLKHISWSVISTLFDITNLTSFWRLLNEWKPIFFKPSLSIISSTFSKLSNALGYISSTVEGILITRLLFLTNVQINFFTSLSYNIPDIYFRLSPSIRLNSDIWIKLVNAPSSIVSISPLMVNFWRLVNDSRESFLITFPPLISSSMILL